MSAFIEYEDKEPNGRNSEENEEKKEKDGMN